MTFAPLHVHVDMFASQRKTRQESLSSAAPWPTIYLMNRFAAGLFLPITFACALFVSVAGAQSQASGSNEIGLYIGEMLPSGIDHVGEILPVVGGRYGFALGKGSIIDLGAFNSHASGIDFTTGELSFRLSEALGQGLEGLFYAGPDFNYYKPDNQSDRKSDFGFHAGAGAMMSVTDSLWLRGDLKLMGGPGTSLYLLFGIVFRSSSGSTN